MYKISDNYKNYIENNTSMSPKSKIVVEGIEYSGNVIKTVPKISHKNEKMFGGFPAKTCSFEIYDLDNTLNFENKEITVYRGLVINGEIEYIPQGVFIPQSDKITTNISQKTISFQNIEDKTQFFDTKYNSKLDWSTTHTGLEIVQEICDNLNIKLENNNFNFSDYNFKRPNFIENISNREIISRLAEIGGSIAFINRNGNLEIKEQTPTGHTIQRKRYGKLSRENQYGIINTVVLGKEDIDDDIVYPDPNMENKVDWKILDNPYVDLYREEMIEEVSKYIIGKSIIPFELTDFVDGNYLDLNDTITIIDRNGEEFTGVILNYENNSRIKSTIGANTQDTTLTNYKLAGSQKQSIGEVKLQVDHINELVQSTVTLVNDQNEKISQVTQTVDELNSKIQNIADITVSDSTLIGNLELNNINASEPINIVIRPIGEDISYLYPHENLFPSETLFMKQRTLRFHNKKTDENIDYELPDDLLYYDVNNYDEFRLDYDTQTCQVIKKVEYNVDGTKRLLTLPETRDYEYPTINLTDGDYEIILLGYESAYLSVRLMAANIYTTQFATKIELNSKITQTSNSILDEVTGKLDTQEKELSAKIELKVDLDNLVSEINASADKIRLTGDRISINSKYFQLTDEGEITASKGTFTGTITGSAINGSTITGSTIKSGFITSTNYTDQNYSGLEINLNDGKIKSYAGISFLSNKAYANTYINGGTLETYHIYVINDLDGSEIGAGSIELYEGDVRCDRVVNNSLEEYKKNIKKFDNALSIIEQIDLYKYNLKSEKDNDKKHIGFVIGKNYNYSSEITVIDTNGKEIGVDTYSMSSLNTQAIKELLERVKVLERKVENG